MTTESVEDTAPTQKSGKLVDAWLVRTASLATLLAVVVAVYFGARAEKRKELELRYVAKLSLVNQDAQASDRVKVSYAGVDVPNLTKLLARVTNTGDLPIEVRDIEEPLTLDLAPCKPLDARIVERSPTETRGEVVRQGTRLQIAHGLLNPRDSLVIEVLCDGDPGWPAPTCRISGIARPIYLTPSPGQRRFAIALVQLPRFWEYVVVALATVPPVIALIVVSVLAGILLKDLLSSRTRRLRQVSFLFSPPELAYALASEAALRTVAIKSRDELVDTLRGAAPLLRDNLWLDEPKRLGEAILASIERAGQARRNHMRTQIMREVDTLLEKAEHPDGVSTEAMSLDLAQCLRRSMKTDMDAGAFAAQVTGLLRPRLRSRDEIPIAA